jgi:hypothetical protein
VRESIQPTECMDGINILELHGEWLGGCQGHGRSELRAHPVSALRFRALAPLMNQLLREISLRGGESAGTRRRSLPVLPSTAWGEHITRYALSAAGQAHDDLEARRTSGQVVLLA